MQVVINGEVFEVSAGLIGVRTSDGAIIYPDSLAQTYAYDAVGRLISTTVSVDGATYKQSYTYADAKTKNIASASQWAKQ